MTSIIIIGGGSGAFAAAIRATERGAKVNLIESGMLGGTCVNVGCIPSKILIRAAKSIHDSAHNPFDGVKSKLVHLDRSLMVRQQQAHVEALRNTKYFSILDSHPDIGLLQGFARFLNNHSLEITASDGSKQIVSADKFLIATGALPMIPNIPGLQATPFWTSTEALQAENIPRHLAIIGGSVVAVEMAQAYSRLGTQVTLIARTTLLSREDHDLGENLAQLLAKEGIEILTHSLPTKVGYLEQAAKFRLSLGNSELEADQLLVATGRRPNTENLGLDTTGVKTDPNGRIIVNELLQTSDANIHAVGDCTTLAQYVYVAATAGTRAATNMTGGNTPLDLSILPTVVYTDPQVASVGLSEHSAREQGMEVETSKLGLENVPRALANFDTRGFIKLVAEKSSQRLVGAHLLTSEAGELIQTISLAIRQGLTIQDLADEIFRYLTMSEGLKLAAQTFNRDVSQLSCCAG
ncbi:mercury(II) reductase [Pseudomonadota bacterium]